MESYNPLAYFDGSNKETLEEHISTMLKVYEMYFKSKNWVKIASKRTSIAENILDTAVRCLIITHDFGKLFYQNRIARGRGSPLHEYYSLLLVNSSNLSGYLSKDVLFSVEWAILMHHMALRNPLEIIKRLTTYAIKQRAPISVRISKMEHDWILKISLKYLGFDIGVPVNTSLRIDEASSLFMDLLDGVDYPLALRLIRILMITDNYAAASNRGGDPHKRVFLKDLPDYNEVMMVKRRVEKWLQD